MSRHEMKTMVDPVDENELAEEWRIEFLFTFSAQEIIFLGACREGSNITLDWVDFLKEVGHEADGDFVNGLYNQALAHIENLVDDGLT